ncbi:MAG: hypothetical protein [Siphoviridae sp. ctdEk19]|nr:MAG: hypothetical protein [Siphoviridae sp. ctdEk19]
MVQPQVKFTDPIPEWSPELEDLKRREELAKALLLRSRQPLQGQMVSGRYVRPSMMEGLSQLAQGAIAGSELRRLTAEKRKLAETERAAMAQGVEEFMRLRSGQPSQPAQTEQFTSPVFLDGQPRTREIAPAVPAVPPDKRGAIAMALGHRHLLLQQLGIAELGREPDTLKMKDLAQVSTPESVLAAAAAGDPSKLKPKRELKSAQPGEVMYDEGGFIRAPQAVQAGGAVPTGQDGLSGPGWGTVTIGGDLYQRTATGLKKLDNAPKTTNVLNAGQAFEPTYLRERGKQKAEMVDVVVKTARGARELLPNLTYLEQLNQKTSVTGPLAEFNMAVATLAQSVGLPIDKEKLGADQAYNSQINKLIMDAFATTPGGARGFTEKETEMLKQSFPHIKQSPQARHQVLQVLKTKALRDIQLGKEVEAEERRLYGDKLPQFDFGYSGGQPGTSEPPELPQPAPAGVQPKVLRW